MKREFSAGGAVYKLKIEDRRNKKDYKGILWLVMKPRPSADFPSERFQLPKGHVEEKETIADAAVREVFEETGIKGKIVEKIASSKYPITFRGERIFKIVTFYLMKYVSGKPTENAEVEKIFWLPYPDAYKLLTYSGDKQILREAAEMLKR